MTPFSSAAASRAAPPPSRPRLALAQFTPTEVALLYADRFLPSFPEPFDGAYRVPLSGRYLDVQSLGQLMAETLLGALFESGSAQLTATNRRGPMRAAPAGVLRLVNEPHGFAEESVEQRAVYWLEQQPSGEAWLDQFWHHVALPARSATPERDACDQALARAERMGMLVPLVRRLHRFIKVREYDVHERHRRVLASVDDGEVRAMVASRQRIPPLQLALARDAWRVAVSRRTEGG
jgi:hypothetical protein